MLDFTILLMTYNAREDIVSTLNSIYASIREKKAYSCELLLVDDNSTDETVQLMRESIHNYKAISWRVIVNSVNLGLSNNLAYSLSLARGRYTVFFSQSDLMNSDIEKAFKYIIGYLFYRMSKPSVFMFSCLDADGC